MTDKNYGILVILTLKPIKLLFNSIASAACGFLGLDMNVALPTCLTDLDFPSVGDFSSILRLPYFFTD